ncbi:MAG TPA: hypothetical protein HPP59_06685 [Deltaproteobacteria bacterium]|nr:hypothetical protein [Deltaproteobacteria bacterium]
MLVEYLFSTSDGDFPAGQAELALPFKITPTQNHPSLTLKDYFDAARTFVLKDQGKPLEGVLRDKLGLQPCFEDIEKIRIRSEKHGVLYHLISLEIFLQGPPVKFSVSTAISEKGKEWLNREFAVLNRLHRRYHFPYLPRPYFSGEVPCHLEKSKETLTMMLSEWFEGYHEWHFSKDPDVGDHKICIWDTLHGNRFTSQEQSFSILRQISRILTLYYEPEKFYQIYPWHHAAGDFIIKIIEDRVDVKLTTARKYESFMEVFSTEKANPVIAILYYFMNLTIRIRLDRLDGVGEIYWAEDFSVTAATTGFFDAVNRMAMAGRLPVDHGKVLLFLFKSFDLDELKKLFDSLLLLYHQDDPVEFETIRGNLKNHVGLFHRTLQEFSL